MKKLVIMFLVFDFLLLALLIISVAKGWWLTALFCSTGLTLDAYANWRFKKWITKN